MHCCHLHQSCNWCSFFGPKIVLAGSVHRAHDQLMGCHRPWSSVPCPGVSCHAYQDCLVLTVTVFVPVWPHCMVIQLFRTWLLHWSFNRYCAIGVFYGLKHLWAHLTCWHVSGHSTSVLSLSVSWLDPGGRGGGHFMFVFSRVAPHDRLTLFSTRLKKGYKFYIFTRNCEKWGNKIAQLFRGSNFYNFEKKIG